MDYDSIRFVIARLLNLVGLLCTIIAAFWIPKGRYDNFIKIFPVSKQREAYRYGNIIQQWGMIRVPNYENIENAEDMLKKAEWGYNLLKAGFIIQFLALLLGFW